MPKLTLEDRFWSKVAIIDDETSCWEWQASRFSTDYGQFQRGGRPHLAHRIAWVLKNGEIPDGLCVCHQCDNPLCVRPEHLWLGTHQDNSNDCVAKDRQAQGSSHGSKLHPEKWARGDTHYSRTHPEQLARGDRNGSRLHPESRPRGQRQCCSETHRTDCR